ncbi:hypothetical protein [Thalassoglobus sp.]|uniref:hypothetical protein n=1 Tax=Thalassoglobus sp. TaxID=2795869 RepID=UPI003AA7F170
MNTLSFRNFITGIAVTVLALDFVKELRVPLTILSVIALLTFLVQAYINYRKSKKQAFQRVLDAYTSRHDIDVSQSGVHVL